MLRNIKKSLEGSLMVEKDCFMKQKIIKSFNKADSSYDFDCQLQNNVCLPCLDLLNRKKRYFHSIVDLACGTGNSTKYLIEKINHSKCYAVDFSENLLQLAKSKNQTNDIEFILSDFDNLDFYQRKQDLLFCNMGLQWSLNLTHSLYQFNSYLKTNGFLVFSMPVNNTFDQIGSDYKNTMRNSEDMLLDLVAAGFDIMDHQIIKYNYAYDSPLSALKSIKNVGANCTINHLINKKSKFLRKNLADIFINPKKITLNYDIAIYIVIKMEEK